ncbi:ISL3 family transposase [Microcoleus sp. Pol7_A1]
MKLLTELLELSGVKVVSRHQHKGIGILLQVEPVTKESICHRCGEKSHKLHQNHRYLIKDLPWGESPVFLEINRRQFKCKKCKKPFSENFDWVGKRRTYTKRLANKILPEVLGSDINSVAKKGLVTTEEIERMLKDASFELSNFQPTALKKMGIDEIALVKGKGNYCAVLIDLEKSDLIGILEKRTQSEIRKKLLSWGTEVLEQIEEVSIDMWRGYKSLVLELMPNAQVVADRFHVMVQVNQELDSQRKQEKRQLENSLKTAKEKSQKQSYAHVLEGLKKSKYASLKNEENLNEEQTQKLAELKEVSPKLKTMHELKEKIRQIFEEKNDWLVGLLKLGMWLSEAQKYFPNSQKTIIRWLDEIIAYFDHRTTSGVVEGINNKLKLIKRSGYGFRNFENFQCRCLLNWHFS